MAKIIYVNDIADGPKLVNPFWVRDVTNCHLEHAKITFHDGSSIEVEEEIDHIAFMLEEYHEGGFKPPA